MSSRHCFVSLYQLHTKPFVNIAPFFISRHGYKLCLRVYLNGDGSGRGTHISFFITLMKGEFDLLLPWPFKQTVSLSLLAQDGVSRDITQSFKPDEESSSFQMLKSDMNVASGCLMFVCSCMAACSLVCTLLMACLQYA